MVDLLVHGNDKMGKEVWLFNLPPVKTCTPTDWCLHGKNGEPQCYALRNRFVWPNVIHGAETRYKLSKEKYFVSNMINMINKKEIKYIRFHASGDFYSEDYVKKIIEIAKNCPDTLFRTTTRRRDLTKRIQELNSQPNFVVRESLDSANPKPIMNLPFAALSYLDIVKKTDAYKCLNDCDACHHYCWKHKVNMQFDEF